MARTFTFDRFTFSIDESGDHGAPVIALHSGGMSSRQWKRLADRLAPTHRVLAVDFIGYGASSPWPRNEAFHYLLDVLGVEALLDSLDEPAHIVGHSYGGLVGLTAALHRPSKVRSLALAEPVAFGVLQSAADHALSAPIERMPHNVPLLPDTNDAAETWLRWFVDYWNGEGGWSALPDRMRASFFAAAHKTHGEVYSLLSDRTPASVWATQRAPIQLLHGELSPPAARRVAEILASVEHGKLHVVKGAGHMAPLTHGSEVNDLIAAHIASH